jgi:hypothetical protein
VTKIGKLGTMLAITSIQITLRRNTMHYAFLRSALRLLLTANVVSSSLILITLIMRAIRYSETSVLPRATRRNIPEDGILHSHRREHFKSYIALTGWPL